jgi:hypothetical protein
VPAQEAKGEAAGKRETSSTSILNYQKYGIDFVDAIGVFEDEWTLTIKQ